MGLGLDGTPWFVERVELNLATRRLDLHLNFRAGTRFIHPLSGQLAPVPDTLQKTWRHLNFFQYECHLHARVPRVQDAPLGGRLMPVPWARPDSGFTLLLEAWIVTLARTTMAVMEVARLVDEYGQRRWRVVAHDVDAAHARTDLGGVKILGLDEVCVRRGRAYLSVASTPATATEPARVLDVAEGRDAQAGQAVIAFAQAHGARIEQAVLDLSPAYRKAVAESLPQAAVSFDWFHVMAKAGEAGDEVRRRELATVRAWTRLEALRDIAAQPFAEAERDLKWWCGWALRRHIPEIQKRVGTSRAHWAGIVNDLRTRVTNATAEALNGIIQTVKRKARGYRPPAASKP